MTERERERKSFREKWERKKEEMRKTRNERK